MLRFILILIISFILTSLLYNTIEEVINYTMTMTFFVTIGWETIRAIRNRNKE